MTNSVVISSGVPEVAASADSQRRVRSGDRLPGLDGIRGIAILLVMTFHFWIVGIAGNSTSVNSPSSALGILSWEQVYNYVAGMGWIGVDLFFVLSGFL